MERRAVELAILEKVSGEEQEITQEQSEQQTGSPTPGKGPGRWEALKHKIKEKLSPWIERAKRNPQTAVVGQGLYNVGFWGEYSARRLVRFVAKSTRKAGNALKHLFAVATGFVCKGLASGWRDITAPFTRFGRGVKNIVACVKEAKQEAGTGHAVKMGFRYFFSGVRRYSHLIYRSVAYVLPVCALAVFVYTVHTVINYNYVLAVEVNGNIVGYVQTEQVFDSAKEEVAQRIQYVSEGQQEWNIEPSYRIAVGETGLDDNQLADQILQASSDDIQEATALYVNGELVAVTTDGALLKQALEDMKAPYEDPNNPNLVVEFSKDVRTEDGIYFTDAMVPVQEIIDKLHGEEQGAISYTVQQGDTPWVIAGTFGISVDQLKAMNPQQNLDTSLYPGDVLLIQQAMPYLQVKRTVTETRTEPIAYKTIEEKDENLSFGTQKVAQEGVEGVSQITEQKIYYDDAQVPSQVIEVDRQTIQEPQDKIIKIGAKAANGDLVETATGSLLWPVPNYTYVSRWMSSYHKGADICAAYGASILAADSGVVVTAGYHYSYGNYVIINHGNGMRTLYAHASRLNVHVGQSVKQGDVIAYVGSTGDSTGNHCHFEVYVNGTRVSARNYFSGK